jgi:Homoserine acetyltransferase
MIRWQRSWLLAASLLTLLLAARSARGEVTQEFASLGDFPLENGQVIRGCKVGYRTHGVLNTERSNAVLFPTWFGGKASDLDSMIGQGGLVDTSGLYVIAVDALGNGVSSSPSNSKDQPGDKFPTISIRDMVESQYRLVKDILKIDHLRAVIGVSMGGMQTFQWMVSHPTFLDRAIPIVGTPKQTGQDLLLWKSELRTIEEHRGSEEDIKRGMRAVARIHFLHLNTPAFVAAKVKPQNIDTLLDKQEKDMEARSPTDWAAQLRAMIDHDIYKTLGGSEEQTEKVIRAKVLVIVVSTDNMVNPAPALRFAERMNARTRILNNDGGHLGLSQDNDRVVVAVRGFLYSRD